MIEYIVRNIDGKLIFTVKNLNDEKVIGILDEAILTEGIIYDPKEAKFGFVRKLTCKRGDEEKTFIVGDKYDETEFIKFIYTQSKLPLSFYAKNPNSAREFINYFVDKDKRNSLGDAVVYEEKKVFTTLYAPYIYFNPQKNKNEIFIPNPSWDLRLDIDDRQIVDFANKIIEKIKKRVKEDVSEEEIIRELELIKSIPKNEYGMAKLFTIWSWVISSFYRLVLWDLDVDLTPILVVIGEKNEGKSTSTRAVLLNSIGGDYNDEDFVYGESDLGGTGIRLKNFGFSTLPFIFDDIGSLENFSSLVKSASTQRLPKIGRRGKPTREVIDYLLTSPFIITTNKLDVREPAVLDRMILIPFSKGDLTEERLFRKLSDDEMKILKGQNYVFLIVFWKIIPTILKEIVEKEGIECLKKMIEVEEQETRTKRKLQFIKFGFELLKLYLKNTPTFKDVNWDSLWENIKNIIKNPSRDYIIESETAKIKTALINYLREVDPQDKMTTLQQIDSLISFGISGNKQAFMILLSKLEDKGIRFSFDDNLMLDKLIFYGKVFLAGLEKQGSGRITGMKEVANALREQGLKCKYCYSYDKSADGSFSTYNYLDNKLNINKAQVTNCIEVDWLDFKDWIEGQQ